MSETLPLPQPFHKRATLRRVEGSKDGGADHPATEWRTPVAPHWHIGSEFTTDWRTLKRKPRDE